MRKVFIAGNWKMNKTLPETINFVNKLRNFVSQTDFDKVIPAIFPPALYLDRCQDLLQGTSIFVGSQDVSKREGGAYTGEISAIMLKSMGIKYSLVGHSESREYHYETNQDVNCKAKILLKHGIVPVVCVGEQETERDKGITDTIILKQLQESLTGIKPDDNFVIAYEPVWAIGTGKTATPEIARQVHQLIRNWLTSTYGQKKAETTYILYGGSIKTDNLASLLQQEDIDGGLVGGASLSIDSYCRLLEISSHLE